MPRQGKGLGFGALSVGFRFQVVCGAKGLRGCLGVRYSSPQAQPPHSSSDTYLEKTYLQNSYSLFQVLPGTQAVAELAASASGCVVLPLLIMALCLPPFVGHGETK